MKTTKNTLFAATLTIAVALGCTHFIDTNTAATTSSATQQEIAQATPADNTLFRSGVREDVILVVPD